MRLFIDKIVLNSVRIQNTRIILKFRALVNHFMSDSLYRNSIYLMASTAIMAFFGFFFWIINARLFTPEEIGIATTLISIITLLSSFSILGLNNGIVRYLPTSKEKNAKINTVISLTVIASIISAIVYLLGVPLFSPKISFIQENFYYSSIFIVAVIALTLSMLTESIFIGYRYAKYILAKNLVLSGTKVILPLLLVTFGSLGIFISYTGSLLLAVVTGAVILIVKFNYTPKLQISPQIVRKMMRFSVANYVAGFIGMLPMNILPILITNKLGADISAYYYMGLMISNLLFVIPLATSQSLFAESSYSEEKIKQLLKKSLYIVTGFLVPATAITLLFGNYILLAFGEKYSTEGFRFLQIFVLSGIFLSINYVGSTLMNVKHKIHYNIVLSSFNSTIIITLSYIFISYHLAGIATAWTIGQLCTSLIYIYLIKKFVYNS